jgi:hypothetical protein
MCLMASGKTLSEIAGLLELSEKTVSTYRVRLLDKMRMKTNAEIIRYAILNHLGDLPSRESKRPARRIRNVKPMPAAYSPEPSAHCLGSQTSHPNSSPSEAALRLRVRLGLIPYMGSSGANQLLGSLGDDEEELGRKVESLLRVFL